MTEQERAEKTILEFLRSELQQLKRDITRMEAELGKINDRPKREEP